MAKEPFYVTTPIYYVNDKPHIGHAYCTILADVYRRYYRMFGHPTFFLTGVDEHGQKVQDAAKKRGIDPQRHCDEMQAHFRDLWPLLHVEPDDFIRTTEERHIRVVQHALQILYDKGDIYTADYEGWYSPWVEKFFSEDELVDGKCPETGKEVYRIKERNYFFRMSKYADRLIEHIKTHPEFIYPPYRANEVLGFLKKGLNDLCISRPKKRLSWGIPLPFDEDYVTYVWFDALLNYVTAAGWLDDPDKFAYWWPGVHHFIGKDILTTHSVYWTTMLMALEIPLPKRIVATGWWLIDDTKMSKSLGNVVSPLDLREKYGPDVLRYFLMRGMVIGKDANFSEIALVERYNGDLVNDFANLLSRTTKLSAKLFGPQIPQPGEYTSEDEELIRMAESTVAELEGLVKEFKLDAAIEKVLELVRAANKYYADSEPWAVAKSNKERAATILYVAMHVALHAAVMLHPIMPVKTLEVIESLGAKLPETFDGLRWGILKPGAPLTVIKALFPRVDLKALKKSLQQQAQPPKKEEKAEPQLKPEISIEDFAKLDIRVGKVLKAEPVEGSSKLIRMEIDLGELGIRQIVGGLAKNYTPEDLVGKVVIVLANLKPRKLFGLESQGMLLAAVDGKRIALLEPDKEIPIGSKIS